MAYALIGTEDRHPNIQIGGLPKHGVEFDWPVCKTHSEPLMFLAQVPINIAFPEDDRLLLLFQCQVEPGLCDDWKPLSGDNAAIIVQASEPMKVPELPSDDSIIQLTGTRRDGRPPIGELSIGIIDYPEVVENGKDTAWWNYISESELCIAGKTGHPTWIQGDDEVPNCTECNEPMTFVVQLNEVSKMNLCGGGNAYGMICRNRQCQSSTGGLLMQR